MRKFLFIVLLIFPGLLFAQVKSYSYQAINFDIRVNQDSTFDVTERQTFDYRGSFHAATRDIPLRLVGSITDVQVIDGATSAPLQFSAKHLDKLDPNSWGKYTRYRSGGTEHIEWYYNLADTTHEWIIKYQVHGGLSFYRDHDELYWNLFTDYQVPINQVEARVTLPPNQFSLATDYFKATAYASSVQAVGQAVDNQTFLFTASNLGPREKLTIAAGWPKGLVSEQSYWLDWLKINWAYFLALLIALGSFIYGLVFWLKHEKFNQGRGTIVAQYEPPEKLKSAMVEVIIKEKITDKAWSATIIDLAVRGYVKIEEEKTRWFNFGRRDYLVLKLKSFDDPALEDYEKEFLGLLFSGGERFSTKELHQSGNEKKRSFSLQLIALKTKLYKETELDTGAYEVGVNKESKLKLTIILTIFGLIFLAFFVGPYLDFQFYFLFATIILCVAVLASFVRYEARLSKAGQILKEEWLGFKLYLETAEKYRLQNLTPDLFEKYLPYAIVLGVEKKWGEAFRGINVPMPTWYGSGGTGFSGGFSSSSLGNFSASMFSASFSSSFTSAFGASGGGASGGGGGAGGGGGGGGGSAS